MGNPKDRDHADNDLASWVKANCPELPDSMRNHIKTMTELDGQGQDVLIRLILLAVRDKVRQTDLAVKIAQSIQKCSVDKVCNPRAAIESTMEILKRHKEKHLHSD